MYICWTCKYNILYIYISRASVHTLKFYRIKWYSSESVSRSSLQVAWNRMHLRSCYPASTRLFTRWLLDVAVNVFMSNVAPGISVIGRNQTPVAWGRMQSRSIVIRLALMESWKRGITSRSECSQGDTNSFSDPCKSFSDSAIIMQ